MRATIREMIVELGKLAEQYGEETPVGCFCGNQLRGDLKLQYSHRECRKTGELFSGVVIQAATK